MEASVFARAVYVVLTFCFSPSVSQYILEEPVSQAVPTNGSLHLSCHSPNSAHISWFRGPPDAGLVPVTGDPRITTSGGNLSLTSFHASEHAGLYYCLAVTETGQAVWSCPADVTHATIHHQFSEEPEDTVVPPGTNALLHCHFSDSNPSAFYRWKKDGHLLSVDNERVILSPSGNLYIMNVSEADEGDYQCLAMNEVTEKTRRSRISSLSVNASLSCPPPSLISSPETPVRVQEGGRVVLECATDDPTATISWTHSSLVTPPPNSFVLHAGPLVIENVTTSDSGTYICRLTSSSGGFVTAAFASLSVTSAPTVAITGSETVLQGSHLSLSCSVTSSSEDSLTVIWFKGTEVVQSSQHTTTGTIVNTLSRDSAHPNDTGLYQCMAYNSAGCGRSVVTVTVETPPPTTAPPPPVMTVSVDLLPDSVCCTVTGNIADITFGILKLDETIESYFSSTDGNSTHIVHVDQYSGSGQYTCEVRLKNGDVISDSALYIEPTSPPSNSTVGVVEATPTPSPHPPPPTGSSINISVSVVGSVAHCLVSGDFSLFFTGFWTLNETDIRGFFSVPPHATLAFFVSTDLSEPGTYTCQVGLTTGAIVSASVSYMLATPPPPTPDVTPPTTAPTEEPSLSPSPSPTEVSPSVTLTVRQTSLTVNCILSGDLEAITHSFWIVHRNNVVLSNSSFSVDTSRTYFYSALPISGYASYTCHVILSNGERLSDTIDHEDPSLPVPSMATSLPTSPSPPPPPPPPPSPTPTPTEATPSITLRVQKTSLKVNCILSGDLNTINFALWTVRRDDEILLTSPFDVDTSREYDFSSLPLSHYATYTCHVVLSDGQVLTESILHEDPSPPSPSPSPSPSPTSIPTPPPAPTVSLHLLPDRVTMLCSASLRRREIVNMTIFRNGTPLGNGEMMLGNTTTVLAVTITDPGTYRCVVSAVDGQILESSLYVPPPPVFVSPPTSLVAEWVEGKDGSQGNIRVRWGKPTTSQGLKGYKINWDQPTLIEKIGGVLLGGDVFEYTITNLDVDLPYVILVWAFSISGDHEAARFELPAFECPSPSPSPPVLPPLTLADCWAVSPHSAILSWQINQREQETVTVSYSCQQAGTSHSSTLSLATRTSLNHLLPNCRYLIQFGAESCLLNTPPGPIKADFNVTVVDETLVVSWWGLPPELGGASGEGVKVEVNVTGEWVEVGGANGHTLDPPQSTTGENFTIHLRFSHGGWSSILAIPVTTPLTNQTTPTPTDDSTSDPPPSVGEQIFLYGTVIAVAVIVCVAVVGVILVLKYIQITHRDTDKVTDHRLYHRQQLHRMSLEKSSLRNENLYSNGVNGVNGTGHRSKVSRVTHV